MKTYAKGLKRLLVSLMVIGIVAGTQMLTADENRVVDFFRGSELQIETGNQKQALAQALKDMLRLSPQLLKTKRYPDYQGNKGIWTPIQILSAYYVPSRPRSLEPDRFYRDLASQAAKVVITQRLKALHATASP
jgi:hypothetical protein